MNVIIVSKFFKTPRTWCLREPRVALVLTATLAVLMGFGAVTGYGLKTLLGEDGAPQVEALRQQVESQQQEFAKVQEAAQHELNAMSVKLAELQAEATRINALGMRLTQIAHLDDGEFNFDEAPAVGGPASETDIDADGVQAPTGRQLGGSIDALTRQLSMQSQQLDLLESVLSDRELDASLLPAGRPVNSGYVSSGFGRRSDPFSGYSAMHKGVDFAGQRGSDVYSVADGVVQFSGRINGYGNAVEIDHGNGYVTRYAHNQKNLVAVGDRIKAGQVIAEMGSTGRSTGSHVHFEVWVDGRAVNPNQYLRNVRG